MVSSKNQVWWLAAVLTAIFSGVWLFVPIYKMYCQATGQGIATQGHKEYEAPVVPEGGKGRLIQVDFHGQTHMSLNWDFEPCQRRVVVTPGETALAFFRAKNKSPKPIIGVSVYHMIPPEAGLYFNKIQCFCFDEQLLNPGEEVDMPIFFFIDPLLAKDARFDHVDRMTLTYIFFESDSEVPPEYQDMLNATRTSMVPPALAAPQLAALAPAS